MSSFELIAATAGLQDEKGNAAVMRLEDRAAGSLREAEIHSDDTSSKDEHFGENFDDEEGRNYQECDLPIEFLGATIQHQHPTLNVDTNNNDSNTEQVSEGPNNEDASNCPPNPWGSSTAKQKIIDELKDELSDVHLLVGQYTATNFSEVNFRKILQKYAGNKRYKMSLF